MLLRADDLPLSALPELRRTSVPERRVSALMASCLAALPLSAGICVDLDQVCVWLEPEDVPPEVLTKELYRNNSYNGYSKVLKNL